ncbi:UNVERIFIED_ORG: hypothetical protein M2438_000054 [Methylobacterium sp. SuP10 SLI 274]|nr:hypothetical protein [Methylobacterium sp. SuP10 SLI 274]
MASAATRAKLQRQPTACPMPLASGTPTMVATDRPRITRETACVRRSRGTSEAATREATPK